MRMDTADDVPHFFAVLRAHEILAHHRFLRHFVASLSANGQSIHFRNDVVRVHRDNASRNLFCHPRRRCSLQATAEEVELHLTMSHRQRRHSGSRSRCHVLCRPISSCTGPTEHPSSLLLKARLLCLLDKNECTTQIGEGVECRSSL